MISHWTFLTDQLVKPVICHDSIALLINIETVIRPWSSAINRDPVVDRSSLSAGAENKMQVTGMEPEDDLASRSPEYSSLSLIEPLP